MLMERQEFLNNSLNTGWLDELIAKKAKTEKPNTMLALICGAINVADQASKFRIFFFSFVSDAAAK
jgi:acetyl-CoA carboxylase / biotin carboxylase 1